MPTRSPRRASLRAPFVVTAVAASALVTACGGRAEVDPISVGDGGADSAPDVGPCPSYACNPPPTAECPAQRPVGGAACGNTGLRCPYVDDCSVTGNTSYLCSNGAWLREDPGGPVTTLACPPKAPLSGTSCFACRGEYPKECDYEYCGSYPTKQASCDPTTQLWQLIQSTCNPPPPPPVDAGGPPGDDDEPTDPPNPGGQQG